MKFENPVTQQRQPETLEEWTQYLVRRDFDGLINSVVEGELLAISKPLCPLDNPQLSNTKIQLELKVPRPHYPKEFDVGCTEVTLNQILSDPNYAQKAMEEMRGHVNQSEDRKSAIKKARVIGEFNQKMKERLKLS